MSRLRVLIGCEHTGVVRDAFIARGFDAISCDLLPTEAPGPHYQGDVRDLLNEHWDLGIFHPECTYLCSSGLHWNTRRPGRAEKTAEAVEFVKTLWYSPIRAVAIENPQGCINTAIPAMPQPQYVQPYHFGHDASKKTGIWSRNLPPLRPTGFVEPRMVNGRPRWGNQTDSGQNKLPPSDDRWKLRSAIYPGLGDAMAVQWGDYLTRMATAARSARAIQ